MPPDLTGATGPKPDPRTVPDAGTVARIRTDLANRFTWPAELRSVSRPLHDLDRMMDLDKLLRLAGAVHSGNELAFAIMSKEYIQTGLNWICAMTRIGLNNFIILSGDQITSDLLDARGVPNVLTVIDESGFDPSFVSTTGFSAKGLAVSAFKFPVARFLANAGYHVVLSDADAVWLRDAMPYLRGADVAFQRIGYHPLGGLRPVGFRGLRRVHFLSRWRENRRVPRSLHRGKS